MRCERYASFRARHGGFGSTSVTVFQPVKPRFAFGTSATLPYNYPYPVGLTSGVNQNAPR